MYVYYQIIMFCALNIYTFICQLYLKPGKNVNIIQNNLTETAKMMFDHISN